MQFTASDRTGEVLEWCHIDAYDDVPLTMVVRTGEGVSGTLAALEPLFPDFVRRQAAGRTIAVAAAPIVASGQVLGGIVVFVDDPMSFGALLRSRLMSRAATVGEELRRAQLRSPRDGVALLDEAAAAGSIVAGCQVEGDPRAIGKARRFLRHLLTDEGIDDDLVDTAVLCLSEILTNAVIHTGAPSELRVSVETGIVTVAVRDQGSPRGDRPGRRGDVDPLRVHGRGLQLVDALAARWGSELDAVGTTVWFVLEPA